MPAMKSPVSEMLVTVKSRELQRGMLAEMRGDRGAVSRHFLAAAHLELVLASDYSQAGDNEMALRSRISAASCFWRSGETDKARVLFAEMQRDCPDESGAIQIVIADLEQNQNGQT